MKKLTVNYSNGTTGKEFFWESDKFSMESRMAQLDSLGVTYTIGDTTTKEVEEHHAEQDRIRKEYFDEKYAGMSHEEIFEKNAGRVDELNMKKYMVEYGIGENAVSVNEWYPIDGINYWEAESSEAAARLAACTDGLESALFRVFEFGKNEFGEMERIGDFEYFSF